MGDDGVEMGGGEHTVGLRPKFVRGYETLGDPRLEPWATSLGVPDRAAPEESGRA